MRKYVRNVLSYKHFICYVRDLYDTICEYLSREWISSEKESVRAVASNLDIDEKTVRRIKNWKTSSYKITLYTLEKICLSRDMTLEEFFKKIKR